MALSQRKQKTVALEERAEREHAKIQEDICQQHAIDIQRLFQHGSCQDLVFQCDSYKLPCHKAMLEARIPGLFDILCPGGITQHKVLKRINADSFRIFLRAIYEKNDLDNEWQAFLLQFLSSSSVEGDDSQSNDRQVSIANQNQREAKAMGAIHHLPQECANTEDNSYASLCNEKIVANGENKTLCDVVLPSGNTEITSKASHDIKTTDCPSDTRSVAERNKDASLSRFLHQGGLSPDKVKNYDHNVFGIDTCMSKLCINKNQQDHQKQYLLGAHDHPQLAGSSADETADFLEGKVSLMKEPQSIAKELGDSIKNQNELCNQHKFLLVQSRNVSRLEMHEYVTMETNMTFLESQNPRHSYDKSKAGDLPSTNFSVSVPQSFDEARFDGSCEKTCGEKSVAVSKGMPKCRPDTLEKELAPQDKDLMIQKLKNLPAPNGTISQALLSLLQSGTFSDVCIALSNGKVISAHRFILECRSDYFAAMLGGGWRESGSQEIDLRGISQSVADTILTFLYGGVASLPDTANLRDVLQAADMYGLEGLKEVTAFYLKREWCHFFHKPLCADCMLLIPHCYALSESFGLPQLSHASLRWMTKHLDRFWAQKVFASLPLPLMNKCSEDVIDQLTADTVMEMLFKLDKVKNQLPPGQTSWAEPVKQLVARTQEKVLDYSIRRFKAIITAGFEEKYLMGMGWKRDVVELLFNKMLSDRSLEHWPTFIQTTQDMLARESASEWNADACALFKDSYSRCYNMVVTNASLIVGTVAWNTMSKDLQVQIKKDAVVVDVRQRQREKPVLSSSQRPKSSSEKKTFNHQMRSHALSSSASSTSSGTTQTFGRGREEGNRSRVQGQRQLDVTHDRRGMRHVPAAGTKSK